MTTGLSLDFGIANTEIGAIESAIAETVDAAEFDSDSESDVTSLVQTFTNSNNDEFQAEQLSEASVALD